MDATHEARHDVREEAGSAPYPHPSRARMGASITGAATVRQQKLDGLIEREHLNQVRQTRTLNIHVASKIHATVE